ncbi:hypothetical protein HanRHA438_Chr02g0092131 [Helianthus annuus]|uniref:Uncharacterized protein n=1 Tax=Helianthus annuus TaxID=4232 RepID=A0A9K3JSD7_HELAN|nr:UPF0481 protein At3g47200-like [Helianthus annuus]KAF5819732.1 hypothetical protein HanXRQr2_Chr02g0080881 [Helianthus annuus]KAJ0605864.1 hypothetical protein HanHA300_Chr02g0067721 [Helianthus annuus]KAJ0619859.1 hypothetical protein HanHA89_Chr02g0075951 [Helianthus annuus]KAJ0787293.1 hypothetical protein HanOQP8_Chr02g0080861 [Helianthus annuus]KAJ0941228.1 hypothetical protein HanRHA438_Chr02g0092131 [Helianthus annuus]
MAKNMDQNHVITIEEEVEIMKTQMKSSPKLLQKSAGNSSCCIFRVPQSLVEINKDAYQPRIVSIGPYHHGNKNLEMIQEHKWKYLDDMITRTGKSLGVFMNIIVSMENEIRESYSESTNSFGTNDLAKIMVLDGFFLIELFRKAGKLVNTHPDDPIFKMVWVSPFLMRDLLKIENQIPFFVLQKLFEESRTDSCTLQSLILKFFNHAIDKQPNVLHKYENLDGKHLLDFFRKSFINTKDRHHLIVNANNPSLKLIQPASKLVNSGLKFKANHQADSFLDIKFQNGRLLIPQINMDDFHTSFLLNCMAFEQCYFSCTKDITTYVMFMSCLMKATTDVNFLSEKKIIENYCGTSEEIVKFFNDVGKDVAFDIKDNYLKGLFVEVNKYCENGLHVTWAEFKHKYFGSPWITISAFSAFMLLSLTVLQTFYTMYPYHKKKD